MEEKLFDRIADEELHYLEDTLGKLDPDELESEYSAGVLTLELSGGAKIVINSHRAAGQIWMAAFRTAWHFTPEQQPDGHDGRAWLWKKGAEELRSTLGRILSEKLGRPITV